MIRWLTVVLRLAVTGLKSRRHLLLENLALRHQLLVSSRDMNQANPLGGAPRIHGELRKLGIILAQRTVAKYMVRRTPRSPTQNWTTFLRNQVGHMVSVDFLTVPTLSFQVLYVFIVLSPQRRRVLHFNVTEASSARWTAQQLRAAFPFTSPPQYLLRDRDSIYGVHSASLPRPTECFV